MELLIISIFRALVEVAGMFLLGQGILYVLAGRSRESNVIYRLFQTVTGPVVRLVRAITPRQIVDRHVPVVAFFLLLWIWLMLAFLRRAMCEGGGLAC